MVYVTISRRAVRVDNLAKLTNTSIARIEELVRLACIGQRPPGSYRPLRRLLNHQKKSSTLLPERLPNRRRWLKWFSTSLITEELYQGYGSRPHSRYRDADIVKVDMMVNGEVVEALCFMQHRLRLTAAVVRFPSD